MHASVAQADSGTRKRSERRDPFGIGRVCIRHRTCPSWPVRGGGQVNLEHGAGWVPRPRTVICPCIRLTSVRTMNSPSPVPGFERSNSLPMRTKRPKILRRSLAGMPGPLSMIRTRTRPPPVAPDSIAPPALRRNI